MIIILLYYKGAPNPSLIMKAPTSVLLAEPAHLPCLLHAAQAGQKRLKAYFRAFEV